MEKPKLHVELRRNAGEVIKPNKLRVDAYALVETRTGVTLRWAYQRGNLDKEVKG